MILRFRHRGLERLYQRGDASGLSAQHVRKLRQILNALDHAAGPSGMSFPGFQLHPLQGGRKGQWAVSVSGNWRVVFEFDGADVINVDLLDYH